MIYGVGMDMLEISRMKKIIEGKAAQRFLERILTLAEREVAAARKGRLSEFIAGRFAAKEAVVKALGTGVGQSIGFQDIEIMPDALGKPCCTIAEAALKRLGLPMEPTMRIHLSITHSESMAAAYVILEQE
ncbi:MAG: holo-ACP synthase [Paenibacillaceae bacterium]